MNKTSKLKNFKELLNYRRSLPVIFDGKELFRINEPTGELMTEIIQKLMKDISKNKSEDNLVTVFESLIIFAIRELQEGLDDVKDMTDKEIIEVINSLGSELQFELSKVLNELVFTKVEKLITTFTANLAKSEG